jgi:hypothetical protein
MAALVNDDNNNSVWCAQIVTNANAFVVVVGWVLDECGSSAEVEGNRWMDWS